jgi:hypothetical protein
MQALLVSQLLGTMSGNKQWRCIARHLARAIMCPGYGKVTVPCQERRRIYTHYTASSLSGRRERSPSELRVTFGIKFVTFGTPSYSVNISGAMY